MLQVFGIKTHVKRLEILIFQNTGKIGLRIEQGDDFPVEAAAALLADQAGVMTQAAGINRVQIVFRK